MPRHGKSEIAAARRWRRREALLTARAAESFAAHRERMRHAPPEPPPAPQARLETIVGVADTSPGYTHGLHASLGALLVVVLVALAALRGCA